jgi:hypothetical protein
MANEAPVVPLVILGFNKKGLKGAVVVFVAEHWLTIASARMLRMSFLINFFGKLKLS